MTPGGPVERIVVAGGGIVGWSAAAALRLNLPHIDVCVVSFPPPDDALAERISSTLPSLLQFNSDIGVPQSETIRSVANALRLGTSFEGWAEKPAAYIHAYGEHGQRFGTDAFHLHWARAARSSDLLPFDRHSPAAEMARAGRFASPDDAAGTSLPSFGFGLQVDLARYRETMRVYALQLGAREWTGAIGDVELDQDGTRIAALRIVDGPRIEGDLFLDCAGPSAPIRSRLGLGFEDWSRWLPCDRILFAQGPAPQQPGLIDRVVAIAAGWRWEAGSLAGTSHGIVFSSLHLQDPEAARLLHEASGVEPDGAPLRIRSGRLGEAWRSNCVAVGDAAVSVEPLEWANLHLAHSHIDRIVAMMPGSECSPVELRDYNRQYSAEADRIRDFLVLHYAASRRSEPFWQERATIEPPASLAHTLALFADRGRLPFYEEETFSSDSWLAVLLGQGVMPRNTDPLIDPVPVQQAELAIRKTREAITEMVSALPPHSVYLQQLSRQAAR